MGNTYGVNRLSVRMAFQKLNTLGVIETRVGEGSYVKDFSMYPILNEIVDFYNSKDRIGEIKKTRRLQYHQLRDLMLQKENDDLFEKTIDADFAFHSQLAHMSHNRLYEEIYYMVQRLIRSHISLLLKRWRLWMQKLGAQSFDGHDFIYEQVCKGNVEEARKLMEEMLDVIPPAGQPENEKLQS